MKNSKQLYFILALFAVFTLQSISQITISKTDFDNNFSNSERTSYNSDYDSGRTFNMGNASATSQTFNFSSIPAGDSVYQKVSQFISPNGLPGASHFPDATDAQKVTQYSGPILITIAGFYQITNSGVYGLGTALNYYYPPIYDTTIVSVYSPKAKFFPLPLTYGTQNTSTDSLIDFDGNLQVTTRTVNCNGYGTINLPDNSSLPALRVQTDEVQLQYKADTIYSRDVSRHIAFWSQNLVTCEFSVDTSFTGGEVTEYNFSYDKRTGAAGVKEISHAIPSDYQLSQNYPNPFNPTTTINFKVAEEGFTTLKIFDVLGQEIATLVNKNLTAGSYSATWDASKIQSGVYFYKLQSGNYTDTKKLMLMK